MDISKKVKRLLLEKNLTATALAEKISTTQSNMSYKMNNNAFSVKDMEKISEVLDVELEINFILKDGTVI